MSKVKDPKRVASGKKSKRKGSSFELKLSKAFQDWWGVGQFVRSPGSGGWGRPQHKEGFRASGDIITTNLDFPWCLEAKHCEGWTLDQLLLNEGCIILKWWTQTVEETPEGLLPMLIFKKNRQPPMMMILATDKVVNTIATNVPGYNFMYTTTAHGDVVIAPLRNLFSLTPYEAGRKDEPTT